MSPQNSAYFFALTSAILFSGASVIYARYSVSHSSLWMNLIKNSVAAFAFVFCTLLAIGWGIQDWRAIQFSSTLYLLGSGMIGLAIGDYFLFRGYQRIGSARTLMVFSFSPLFLTLEGFLLFGQSLHWNQAIALFLMMACVWTISFEKFRDEGSWEWKGILFAVVGVLLDNVGIVFSRKAFDQSPELGSFYANAIRAVGAVVLFSLLQIRTKERAYTVFWKMRRNEFLLITFTAFMGTFLSLYLWLTALKIGHIGGLAGVGSFNPVAASIWEWVLLRKKPTKYLVFALSLFLVGFYFLVGIE